MKQMIPDFSNQLQEALIIGQSYKFRQPVPEISNIVFAGMGSNATAGIIIQNHVADKLGVPFIVCRDYALPSFINAQSLIIIASYSGNTAETIGFMKQALKAKCKVVCITSGGKIAELARKKKIDCILLPAGMSSRSCIGYMLVQALFILRFTGLLDDRFRQEIKSAIRLLQKAAPDVARQAKIIARKLHGRLPVVYTSSRFEGVALRFRHQLNEHGKVLALHNFLPGMNHNEMEGWYEKLPGNAVILLRDADETEQVAAAMNENKQWFQAFAGAFTEIIAPGKNYWAQVFWFIQLTDAVSLKLAALRGVDLTEVKAKTFPKSELSGLE